MEIDFVSYDGKYPNLCSGTLTLCVDGKPMTFGYGADNDPFWTSGGCVYFDSDYTEHVEYGPWLIDKDRLPSCLQPHAEEITKIFNDYVPDGCCGGCI